MSISEIEVSELARRVADGALVIDVREPDEYAAGHVPGAKLVPLASVPDNLDVFNTDGPTYVICAMGGRSMRACEYAADHDLEVVNVAGGTKGWLAAGHECITGDCPT